METMIQSHPQGGHDILNSILRLHVRKGFRSRYMQAADGFPVSPCAGTCWADRGILHRHGEPSVSPRPQPFKKK